MLKHDAMHTLLSISDEERHPLIAENDDWDKIITPALQELGAILASGAMDMNDYRTGVFLRTVFETVYVIGYRSGKGDQD